PSLAPTADAGKVRLGGYAPSLAPTADAGKVRLGGYAPSLAPTADAGNRCMTRIGIENGALLITDVRMPMSRSRGSRRNTAD
ncbi:MAG TPA: hypothetical protein VHY82_15765, partial [Acetobacteraceae bacterium]|nr:hypothetical protein [Acetobacteraceae bacterium]